MSRNLLQTECDVCDSEVEMVEDPRKITVEDAGVYFEEYESMVVADAECTRCHAKYLAWVEPPQNSDSQRSSNGAKKFFDLSYRSTFNDEPGEEDIKHCSRNLELKRAKEEDQRLQKLRDRIRKRAGKLTEQEANLVISLLDVIDDLKE